MLEIRLKDVCPTPCSVMSGDFYIRIWNGMKYGYFLMIPIFA